MRNHGSIFIFALSFLTFLAAGAVTWGCYEFVHHELPDVSVLRTHYPTVHYEGCAPSPVKGAPCVERPPTVTLSRLRPSSWASVSDVSKVAVGAILVSEDWAFYQHKGYDPNQIKEAIKEDWEEGRFARGASTITQQVVRNVFLDKDKNLWRKLKELILAVRLEETVGKRKILETYLNVAEWGEGLFGIQAWLPVIDFGKEPGGADRAHVKARFSRCCLPSPKRYSQSYRAKRLTDYARDTVDSILVKMTQAHYITEEQRVAAGSVGAVAL